MRVLLEIAFSFKRELAAADPVLDLPEGADVAAALRHLGGAFPEIRDRLFAKDGRPHRHINALVNGENVTFKRGFATRLRDGDHLTVVPPVGGG